MLYRVTNCARVSEPVDDTAPNCLRCFFTSRFLKWVFSMMSEILSLVDCISDPVLLPIACCFSFFVLPLGLKRYSISI